MTNIEKRIGLLSYIAKGLVKADGIRTVADLGDRSTYMGMSDISSKCPRKVVLGKLNPSTNDNLEKLDEFSQSGNEDGIQEILKQLVTFGRGHAWESILSKGFDAQGSMRIPQLEIRYNHQGTPIRAHLDDTLVFSDGSIRILEHKCNEKVQDKELYPENELQIYGQLGLLKGLWEYPCFGITTKDGESSIKGKTFPELVKMLFDFDLPASADEVCIEGYVISVTLNPNQTKNVVANPFGPYIPNDAMTQECLERAKWRWKEFKDVQSGQKSIDEIRFVYGFNPLCDFCDHCEGCPKFQVTETPELEADLECLFEKKKELKQLEAEVARLQDTATTEFNNLMKAQTCFEENDRISFIQAGPFKFKVSERAGWKNLNKGLLEKSLLNLSVEYLQKAIENRGFTLEMVNGIIDSAIKQGDPFTVVNLNKLKPKKTKKKAEAVKLAA